MHYQHVFYVIGLLILALGGLMLAPAAIDYYAGNPSWISFAESAGFTLLAGALCVVAYRPQGKLELNLKETFILTTVSWLVLSIFATLPFVFTPWTETYTDSFFEVIAALTTTGATVISGLDFAPYGILLWRSLLQWMGGIGIVVMAMTVLPILRVGGMQLFRSEFSDRSEKILPRISQITKYIFYTYATLTALCAFLLWISGIPAFESICHAMTTLSTGGMSTSDSSVGFFQNSWAEFIIIIFMVLGATTLLHFVRIVRGDFLTPFKDQQVRLFYFLVLTVPLTIHLWRFFVTGVPFFSHLLETYFNTLSMMTCTGYATSDFSLWGSFPLLMIMTFTLVGACTGSTGGGIKVFRFIVVAEMVKIQLYKLFRPNAVYDPRYNDQTIPDHVFVSVFAFFALFTTTYALVMLGLGFFGLDFLTAVSGATATITNAGPGFGDIIGPSGNYSTLPSGAKWVLIASMLLGRLEFVTIIIICLPEFWRD